MCDTFPDMTDERRRAPRHLVPEGLTAEINGVAVKLLELSLVGGKVEHQERFTLTAPQLALTWRGKKTAIPVRAARSEIVGRSGAQLIYNTALTFIRTDAAAEAMIASIFGEPEAAPVPPAPPKPKAGTPSADDSWTRQVTLLHHDLDEHLPYAQFRLTPTGWEKEYVASPAQPEDGFTIPRERRDFDELQRTFEAADPDTRRMMQIALESQLQAAR